MHIKKIASKLDFDVEAQCSHGTSSVKGGCKADCTHKVWAGQTAEAFAGAAQIGLISPCHSTSTYYSCSISCLL